MEAARRERVADTPASRQATLECRGPLRGCRWTCSNVQGSRFQVLVLCSRFYVPGSTLQVLRSRCNAQCASARESGTQNPPEPGTQNPEPEPGTLNQEP